MTGRKIPPKEGEADWRWVYRLTYHTSVIHNEEASSLYAAGVRPIADDAHPYVQDVFMDSDPGKCQVGMDELEPLIPSEFLTSEYKFFGWDAILFVWNNDRGYWLPAGSEKQEERRQYERSIEGEYECH